MEHDILNIKYRIIKDIPFRNVGDIVSFGDIVSMFENDYYKSLKSSIATLVAVSDPTLSEELQKYFEKL